MYLKPWKDPLVHKLEVMNETVTLVLLELLFCFTDLILDERAHYYIGYIFIVCLLGSVCVHLFFLVKQMIHDAKLQWTRRKNRANSKKNGLAR